MMRRRRNQPHAGRRVPRPRDARIYLSGRQLPALAWLRALRHLDLNLLGGGEIRPRHAKTAGSDLLNGGVLLGKKTLRSLAALAGVTLAAKPVHRQRDALMCLLTDGAIGHRPGFEAAHDFFNRFDLLNGNRMAVGEA
ncbi:hypothetical protein SDC9_91685 [bioreactor metagenome]|uniref:Uncharacterized protein n=1 Tax=bioreactor metagenome TaxID=1076179 RepID=A0A644ZVK7_9ZZZZ